MHFKFIWSTFVVISTKVKASIVDWVHITACWGHAMPTWMISAFYKQMNLLRFMWWWLVIDSLIRVLTIVITKH